MRIKYTKEILENVISVSTTWAEVCRKLGVKPMTGSQTNIKKRAVEFEINFSHFTGSAWNKGRVLPKKDALEFCYDGSNINSHKLKERLIRDGYKDYKCEICGLSDWHGEKLPLELDHIDSNHKNNEFNNLMILCPNCHSIKTRRERKKMAK